MDDDNIACVYAIQTRTHALYNIRTLMLKRQDLRVGRERYDDNPDGI